MEGDLVVSMLRDRAGDLWLAGSKGLAALHPDGSVRRFSARDGLPDPFVRSLWQDRDGNIWAGTNGGLARYRDGHFVSSAGPGGRDWVRIVYEDREGDLWVGMNSGLARLRDDVFTVSAKAEGLPSDEPIVAFEDRRNRLWVGFHDAGLGVFAPGGFRAYSRRDGLRSSEVFSIRETAAGDLLLATREGLSRMHGERFENWRVDDELGRRPVFDAIETRAGALLLATPGGLRELVGQRFRTLIPGGQILNTAMVALAEGRDGTVWAGTFARGLWRWKDGQARLFTTADGLPSDQIRSLVEDQAGTLWIGTYGGGLGWLRGGRFARFTARDGLLSDNVSDVEDDRRGYLWLSTTRGICQVEKRQLEDFASGRLARLTPVNYGVADGLRSAQCAPGFPVSGGGTRSRDGRLWFPTSFGLAMLNPSAPARNQAAPATDMVDVSVDGSPLDLTVPARIPPGSRRVQFRYTGIHLSAPERVRYTYRLEGVDTDWVAAGVRRAINYTGLKQGKYRFRVRAQVPGGAVGEASYAFTLLPYFYETAWFRICVALALAASVWAAFRLRVRQMRGRFSLVLQERARLAREIHDTLAQGFVGISSQLDAVAMCLDEDPSSARQFLDLARRMVRHSLTEARRSVMDLRASVLEGQDLGAALDSGARMWVAGSGVEVAVEVVGEVGELPPETDQHLLRIAQEAVHNAIKHAAARHIAIRMHTGDGKLRLQIEDDGRGFDPDGIFTTTGGHFGVIGMRERAQRIHGELRLTSQPGRGTQVEVTVPLG
jgi:signal transduction histidine kinase